MSKFFSYFPKLLYTNTAVVDILNRVGIRSGYTDKDNLFFKYILKDNDTPENIAAQYYGDSGKFWIVLMFNDLSDGKLDFPLAWDVFNKYLDKKYYNQGLLINRSGSEYAKITLNPPPFENKLTITTSQLTSVIYNDFTTPQTEIHYVDNAVAANTSTLPTTFGTITVTKKIEQFTIWDWENQLNENKRTIKLLKQELAVGLENELKQVLK